MKLHRPRSWTPLLATLAALVVVLAWDASPLDLVVAKVMGGPTGFPWREHPLFTRVLHDGARMLAALMLLALALAIWRPFGPLRQLARGRRVWLLVAVSSAMLMVSVAKRLSATSCPWDVAGLGGTLPHVSHWLLGQGDGGPGHCFPAGHASAGFGWLAGWAAWPAGSKVRRAWLASALVAGVVLGVAQQMRGAHFMSHTLWTAWLCWSWGLLLSPFLPARNHAPAAH